MIKLIALDLDGTLLKHNETIDHETLQALKELKDVRYTIATGRCLSFVENLVAKYELDCDLILNNGHEFISKDKKTKLYYSFKMDHLREIINICFKYSSILIMYDTNGKKYTFTKSNKLYQYHIKLALKNIFSLKNIKYLLNKILIFNKNYFSDTILLNSIDDLDNLDILKIDVRSINKELATKTLNELNLLDNIAISSWDNGFFEVCEASMNKGLMIKSVAQMYNISLDEVAAFGDSSNDIEMLDMVKYSFAMGNASNEIKKHGKFVTDTNENQGVLKGIQQLQRLDIIS